MDDGSDGWRMVDDSDGEERLIMVVVKNNGRKYWGRTVDDVCGKDF